MAEKTISESRLNFIVEQEKVFVPEDEDFYKKLSSRASVKICDLIYLRASKSEELLFIEVKSSSPKDTQDFVKGIRQKFVDSILVYVGAIANRRNTQAKNLPDELKSQTALTKKMRLVLIVKNLKKPEWRGRLRDDLQKECKTLEKLFSLEATQVYDPQLAISKLKMNIYEP